MALTMKVLSTPPNAGDDSSQRRVTKQGTAVVTGSYTAGGETINWLNLSSTAGEATLINTLQTVPVWAEFYMGSPASATPSYAFLALYNYATNKLQFYGSPSTSAEGTGLEELAAGAYSASMTGATFYWKAEFIAE